MSNEFNVAIALTCQNPSTGSGFRDVQQFSLQLTQSNKGKQSQTGPISAPGTSQTLHGKNQKPSAACATTTTLPACTYANGASGVGATLTGNSNGAFASVDGVSAVLNMRVLVKNQAAGAQNGLYKLTTLGDGSNPYVLTRDTAMDTTGEFVSDSIYVEAGTVNAATQWTCTNASAPTVGTTAITFLQSAAGTALSFGQLTTAGLALLQNLDSYNSLYYGAEIGGVLMPAGLIKPGEVHLYRVESTMTLRAVGSMSNTSTSGTFVVPAVASTVAVAVASTSALTAGQSVSISDGTRTIYGTVTVVTDSTHFTVQTVTIVAGSAGDTMSSGAFVCAAPVNLYYTIYES